MVACRHIFESAREPDRTKRFGARKKSGVGMEFRIAERGSSGARCREIGADAQKRAERFQGGAERGRPHLLSFLCMNDTARAERSQTNGRGCRQTTQSTQGAP